MPARKRAAAYESSMQYIMRYQRRPGVPEPERIRIAPGIDPHDYVAALNGGRLPYTAVAKQKKSHWMLPHVQGVVYECGPWSGCRLGLACPQAMSQQGLKYRLEVFKTRACGWAVRTWDLIPAGVCVSKFLGEVWAHKQLMRKHAAGVRDDMYFFDMGKRTDFDDGGLYIGYRGQDPDPAWTVDAMQHGNVSRFINHSCEPNLYVQPVAVGHRDLRMPHIALFSSRVIAPFAELTYDYGSSYVENKLEGCQCGAAACISKKAA